MKPNLEQVPGYFDESFVYDQLKSSGTMAYYELMQFGYPDKILIDDLYHKLEPYLQPRHISIGHRMCCFLFLLANGFKMTDMKIGKSSINIRPGNSKLLEKIQISINGISSESVLEFTHQYVIYERRVLRLRLRFIAKRKIVI